MALDEKIQKKAEGYGKLAPAFIEGAKFTLKNQWISVEDDLPCNHNELISLEKSSKYLKATVYVIARINGIYFLNRMYELDGKWHWENDKPTHWMPIPELPKE